MMEVIVVMLLISYIGGLIFRLIKKNKIEPCKDCVLKNSCQPLQSASSCKDKRKVYQK
ncbi:hypothetical protein J2T56_000033 [Natronobacillus azotifigens]